MSHTHRLPDDCVSHQKVIAKVRRVLTVHPAADVDGMRPNLTRVAYRLYRLEVLGRWAHVRTSGEAPEHVSGFVIALERRAMKRRGFSVGSLANKHWFIAEYSLPLPDPQHLRSWRLSPPPDGLRFHLRGGIIMLLVLGGLWWMHATSGDVAGLPLSFLLSRYGATLGVVTLAWVALAFAARHHRAEPAFSGEVLSVIPPAAAGKLPPADTELWGMDRVQGKVQSAVYWEDPGPEIDGANNNPAVQFELMIDGHRYRGQSPARDSSPHPFAIEGDEVRLLVDKAIGNINGRPLVAACYNLTDGHVWHDDGSLARYSTFGALSGILGLFALMFAVAGFLLVGPSGDDIAVFFAAAGAFVLLPWLSQTLGLREFRNRLLRRSMGVRSRREMRARSLLGT